MLEIIKKVRDRVTTSILGIIYLGIVIGVPGLIIYMIFIPDFPNKPEILIDNFSDKTINIVFDNGKKTKDYSLNTYCLFCCW
jgi:hypothetical protein